MSKKLYIGKNTVQETLVIPLYARKKCTELFPTLYRDETAARLIECIDYDFSANEAKARSLMQRFGFLEVAARQNDLAWEVRDYLREHPRAAVVNLGAGSIPRGARATTAPASSTTSIFPTTSKPASNLRESTITAM